MLRRMMNGDGQGRASGKEPVERVVDLFLHVPIGFALMAWKRGPAFVGSVPELVGQALAKGCAQLAEAEERLAEEVRKARMIGQVAVTFGGRQVRREVDARLAEARRTAGGVAGFIAGGAGEARPNGAEAPTAAPAAEPAPPKPRATRRPAARSAAPASAASADVLPIREYDGLSASQVVSRLTGLTPEELRAVRAYEEGSRGRRTVILAIDRLLD
jgi:hypothetical protein